MKIFFRNKRFYAGVPKHQQILQDNKKPLSNKTRRRYRKFMNGAVVPQTLFSIRLGLGLGDRTFYKGTDSASIKFEYGHKDKEYTYHICDIFRDWTWYSYPSQYVKKSGERKSQPHSYHFQTFKHKRWKELTDCFFLRGAIEVKGYAPGSITKHLCEIGLAYWMFNDGSYNKGYNYYTLHRETFSLSQKEAMCKELNRKFNLHCYLMKRSSGDYMIYFPTKDTPTVIEILHKRPRPLVMHRKFPNGWNSSVNKKDLYFLLKSKIALPNSGYSSFIKMVLFIAIYYSLNSGFFGI